MATKRSRSEKQKTVQEVVLACFPDGIEVEDAISLATLLLLHFPQPGGHIQVRLRPEFVLRNESAGTRRFQLISEAMDNLLLEMDRSAKQMQFFIMIRNCLLNKEPHDGLLWLNPNGPLEGREVFTARITPLFTGLDMIGNARRFAEEICPFCSHVRVLPPEQEVAHQ
ncbi:MAG: hypothetical protein WCT33_03825 [Patescibacteria group bacterium]|jgi:hypothetical protein